MPIRFFKELQRRNVLRMALAYAIAAWLVLQVADIVFEVLRLPDGSLTLVFLLLAVGFPLVLIFSWFFEITPEGLRWEKHVDRRKSITVQTGRRLDFIIIAILSAAVLVLVLDRFVGFGDGAPTKIQISDEKSIAVLPFVNMSRDEATEPFTNGIHDDILTQISRLSALKVISRTSVLRYRDTTKSIPEIATELGVTTILEGAVQRAGNRLRINVQLIDASSDKHLWAQTFDRELTTQNILAIQSEIAEAITLALRATLTAQDRANLERLPTENLEAYQAYLLGKQRMVRRSRDSLIEAADYFQEAIDLDPDYAIPYVGLADAHMLLGAEGELLPDELVAEVEPVLTTALSLDDQLAEAHASLGLLREKTGDLAEAEVEYKRAMELDPNYPSAYHWYGNLLVGLRADPQAAIAPLERALELDPLSPVINLTLGEAFDGVGRFDDAMVLFRKAMEIEPAYPSSYVVIAHIHRFVYGQLDEAVRWYREGVARDPDWAHNVTRVGLTYFDLGDEAQAEYWINRALSLGPEKYAAPNAALALLQRYRGQETEALQTARKLLSIAPGHDRALDTLVSLGRYEEALASFAARFPQLVCETEPEVARGNLFRAIDLSLALEQTGDPQCADLLLDKAVERMQTMPRLGMRGYWFADVEVYARQGRTGLALATLRQAIDEGARAFWWAQLEGSPHVVSLREEPEFKSMLAQIRADMAAQLRRLREMEARGELSAVPEPVEH